MSDFGYWPKSYWTGYWFQYWPSLRAAGAKFIARMRRISLHRRNL